MSQEATKDLVEDLVIFDPNIDDLIRKERALNTVSQIDEYLGKNTDAIDEILENTHPDLQKMNFSLFSLKWIHRLLSKSPFYLIY